MNILYLIAKLLLFSCVSKNRIKKEIGTIAGTKLMTEIENRLMKMFSPLQYEKLSFLEQQNTQLIEKIKQLEEENQALKQAAVTK
jgi:hypothetical protein